MILHNKLFHLVVNIYQNYTIKLLLLPNQLSQRFHFMFFLCFLSQSQETKDKICINVYVTNVNPRKSESILIRFPKLF